MARASAGSNATSNREETGDDGNDAGIFRLDLSDAVPQTKTVDLGPKENGVGRRIVQGHVQGNRVLRSVHAEFLAAWRLGHRSETIVDGEGNPILDEEGNPRRRIVQTDQYHECLTRMVLAILPGVTYDEADMMNEDEIVGLLQYLSWYKKTPDDAGKT